MPLLRNSGEDGWVEDSAPFVFTGSGVKPGLVIYRKMDGTTWEPVWTRSDEPAPPAQIRAEMVPGTRNTWNTFVKVPSVPGSTKRVIRVIVKVGIGKMPSGPTVIDDTYIQLQGSNATEKFSEWFTQYWNAPGGVPFDTETHKRFAPLGTNLSVPLNTDVNFVVWTQDNEFVWSEPTVLTVRSLKSTDDPAGMQVFQTDIMPTDADTFAYAYSTTGSKWTWRYNSDTRPSYSGKNWNYSGGRTGRIFQNYLNRYFGFFFYRSTLRNVLNASSVQQVTKMELKLHTYGQGWGPTSGNGTAQVRTTVRATHPGRGGNTYDPGWWTGARIDRSIAAGSGVRWVDITALVSQFTSNGAYSLAFGQTVASESRDPKTQCYYYRGANQSGLVRVTWKGYTNPWPKASPGASGYEPLNAVGQEAAY